MNFLSRKHFLKLVATGFAGYRTLIPSTITPYKPDSKKLGVALVGLGGYSRGQLAPALLETKYCQLAGIVSGTPEKRQVWAKKYSLPDKNVYTYRKMSDIANNDDIDIVYIVLPNAMHADFSVLAAEAGKHVICEKPMATNVKDAQRIIDACNKNKVKLSVGYRLHFEPFNRKMMELGQNEVYGKIKRIKSGNGFVMNWPWHWRLDKTMAGGGPLMDMGIYCIQGCIYTSGEIPLSVSSRVIPSDDPQFHEVYGGIKWEFQYPSGIVAECETTYMDNMSYITVEAEEGTFGLRTAYFYGGLNGYTPKGEMQLKNINQQAAQMDDFALRIKNDEKTPVPGEMGLRDVAIMEAIYKSVDTGSSVQIDPVYRKIDLVSDW